MPSDLQIELWRAVVTGCLVILTAGVGYAVSFLHRMKREQDARAMTNIERDSQRNEVQENVRRLVNGLGVNAETAPPQRGDRRGGDEHHHSGRRATDAENSRLRQLWQGHQQQPDIPPEQKDTK